MTEHKSLVDAILIATETANAGTKWFPNEFAYKKVTLNTYQCHTDDNAFYVIYATCSYSDNWENHSEWVTYKDNTLLQDFLHLRETIGSELFEILQSSNYLAGKGKKIEHTPKEGKERDEGDEDITFHYESRISAPIIEAIKNFCEKHGYPFAIKGGSQKSGNKKLPGFENITPDKYIGFNVLAFLYELDELYGAAHLVNKALLPYPIEIDKDQNVKISRVNTSPKTSIRVKTFTQDEVSDLICEYEGKFDLSTMSDKEKDDTKKKIESLRDRLTAADTYQDIHTILIEFDFLDAMNRQECIERFLQKFKQRHYEYSFEYDGGIFLELRTKNLFDAAFYQLAQMLILPGKQVKICPICKNFFIPTDPRQKYCDNKNRKGKPTCYPEKMYKRKNYIRKIADE